MSVEVKDHHPSDQAKTMDRDSSKNVHRVPWGLEAFPENGSGRTLKIKAGHWIEFFPIDEFPHNVAEADIVGRRWLPARERVLGIAFKTRPNFHELLQIRVPGIYYLVCPVNGHHKQIRLKVIVEDDLPPQVKTELERARQVSEEALSFTEEVKTVVENPQTENNEAFHRKVKELLQKAKTAQSQAENILKNLKNLAQNLGIEINHLIQDLQERIQKVAERIKKFTAIGLFGTISNNPTNNTKNPKNPGNSATGTKGGNNSFCPGKILEGNQMFNLGFFNLFDQHLVIGPLGPIVSHRKQPPKEFKQVNIRWNPGVLLDSNGQAKILQIPVNTVLNIQTTDGKIYPLVEADSNFQPKMNPLIDTRGTQTPVDLKIQLKNIRTYYFVNPSDPLNMRLVVKVTN